MALVEEAPARTDEEVRQEVVSWLRANLPPEWVAAVEAGDTEALETARARIDYQDWCRRLGEAGWATPTWPRRYGGAGLDNRQARIVEEELSRWRVPRSFNVIGIGMAGPTIMQWGTDELCRRYLPPMAQHREIWCQLFSEPGAGSDVASLATRAVRDGDEWVVNGQKVWTTLAHIASYGLLVARTDPDKPKHKGLTYFIVDMHAPGVEVRPLRQMTGDAEFNEVFLNDVRIPDDHRLGPEGEGWAVATTTLMNERVALSGAGSVAGEAVGGGPVDALVRRARRSGAWGDPVVRQRLMRAVIESRLIKVTNLRAQAARKAGRQPGPEGSITKLFAAEHNQRVQNLAADLLGARAMAWDPSDSEAASVVRGFLRSRANTIEGGTSEIMRNILGERVLGLPKEPSVDRDLPWKDVRRSS
ncbi:MAG TPA: acyl-CoA dehydrogenase family protein [Acidimicrobiales bacterium]|nr:acyl-CoA dehydrogenase family protein [Acidimicrobiales bacterium]